jgi:hypothetical protein
MPARGRPALENAPAAGAGTRRAFDCNGARGSAGYHPTQAPLTVFILTHGSAPETTSCDLSTLSSPNGDEGIQPDGTEGTQGNQFSDSLVEVASVCESCGTEIKRTIREK